SAADGPDSIARPAFRQRRRSGYRAGTTGRKKRQEGRSMRRTWIGLTALVIALGAPGAARAQDADYPSRPIRVVVPYPAGGLVDLITGVVTERMAASLGQQLIVESRAGANGTIATASVAHADPDGYTLLMITDSHGVNPLFYKSLSYDSA